MAYYRQGLREQATDLVKDTAMLGVGFAASGYAGRYVEDRFKSGVTSISTTTDKIMAWGANNAPKAGIYILAKMLKADILQDIGKAAAGSIAVDSMIRVTHQGVNTVDVTIKGYRVLDEQKLIAENQTLRTELNRAMQQMAMPFSNPTVLERQRRYGSMPFESPRNAERERYFGSMPFDSPRNAERQRRYGAMPFESPPAQATRERAYGFAQNIDAPEMYDMPFWSPRPQAGRERKYGFAATLENINSAQTTFNMK